MIAWHVLHSDLPKGLGFVATFTCPHQEEWKHLNSARPAFYNATDADVELRSMIEIEKSLRADGLWGVYDRDVVQLEPILEYMSAQGMPIDLGVREKNAAILTSKQADVLSQMIMNVPEGARSIEHVYIRTPKDTTGLNSRPGTRIERACSNCGLPRPRKDHFKLYNKKSNPCAAAGTVERSVGVDEWFRYSEWTPSRTQLIRYQQFLNRPIPTKYDAKSRGRKMSMDNKSLKELIGKYPDDPIYPLVLDYRMLDKLAGTYIGRIE
jgi:hypothetical protein